MKYLYDTGINDADVVLFHGVFENDIEIVKKALDDGADTKCIDKMIIKRYEKEYEKYLSLKNTTR